jgi:hypothetical protein
MCNAWNHPPGCNCGWGGDTGGKGSNLNGSSSEAEIISGAETSRIKCWWCGEEVFYHTNGCGDSVLFDRLGYPWYLHECWKKHKQEQSRKFCSANSADSTKQRFVLLTSYVQRFRFAPDEYSIAREMGITEEQLIPI